MAKFRHISTKLVLVLDAGTVNGKKTAKRVTISNIREDVSADTLWELAEALGKVLAYPAAQVRLYKEEAIERENTDGDALETSGVQKEAGTGAARAKGAPAPLSLAPRGGALPVENAPARILPGGNKRQTGNTYHGSGGIQPVSNLNSRRGPPAAYRGDRGRLAVSAHAAVITQSSVILASLFSNIERLLS